jgi:hypothetical protein
MSDRCWERSLLAHLAGGVALLAVACSSGADGGAGVPDEVVARLVAAAEAVEAADGLETSLRFAIGDEPGTCVSMRLEPAATSAAGERAHFNFGVPHDDYDVHGCLVGTTFTVDGSTVYAHTDEPVPGRLGTLSRVGEASPELIDQLAGIDTGTAAALAALVEDAATGVDQVDDDTVVVELDPEAVDELAPAAIDGAATGELESVTLTARYHPDDPDRLASLEYEATGGSESAIMAYTYDGYDQPQDVEIPVAPYITPDVTPLTTRDELAAFVGLEP